MTKSLELSINMWFPSFLMKQKQDFDNYSSSESLWTERLKIKLMKLNGIYFSIFTQTISGMWTGIKCALHIPLLEYVQELEQINV